MSTKSGRKIGGTYLYWGKSYKFLMNTVVALYALSFFSFLSSAGKTVNSTLLIVHTVAAIMVLIYLVAEAKGRDPKAFTRYTIRKESVDDHGNSTILVEWAKDGTHEWIPNTPRFTEKYKLISE